MVIPNGIDPRRDKADEDCGKPRERIVLTVGRLERYKNIDLIIDAFRSVPIPATLVVVGEGPDRARLENHAAASGSGWPVIFTGSIPAAALDWWFGRARVVTSASEHESFGLTLAEGLASGARVVASGIPAHASLRNLAGPDSAVDLVDPRNTAHFTERLTASLLAEQNQLAAVTLPSWGHVVQMTRELYARVAYSSSGFEAGSSVAPYRSIACFKTSKSG